MTKKFYGDKLLDPRWQKKRLEVLEESNFTCTRCGDKEKTLHVHHYSYSKSRNPWDTDIDSLTCLCCDCHKIEHLSNLTPLEQELVDEIIVYSVMYGGLNETANSFIKIAQQIILKHKG